MATKEMKVFTRDEVAKHNKEGDLVRWQRILYVNLQLTRLQWIIVDSVVFDLSKFAAMHPGGLSVLLDEEVGKCR